MDAGGPGHVYCARGKKGDSRGLMIPRVTHCTSVTTVVRWDHQATAQSPLLCGLSVYVGNPVVPLRSSAAVTLHSRQMLRVMSWKV